MTKSTGEDGRLHPDLRAIARKLRRAGWRLEWRPSGHVHWIDPAGVTRAVTSTTSPSTPQTRRRLRAVLDPPGR